MPLHAQLMWAMWALAGGYLSALAMHGDGWNWGGLDLVTNAGLDLMTVWLPAAVCWLAVSRAGPGRPEVLLSSMAVTSFAVGATYDVAVTRGAAPPGFPSLGDAGYVLFYLFLLAALVVMVHRHTPRLGSRCALLVAGLLIFAATDVIHGLRVGAGISAVGTPLHVGWVIGLALIAVWVDHADGNVPLLGADDGAGR